MLIRDPIVCIVTRARGRVATADRVRLIERLEAAAEAGASMIQVRERQLDDRQLAGFIAEVVTVVRRHGTLVIVNDRLDIARAARADGVHLKSDGPSAGEARRVAASPMIVGRSVHSVAEAQAAGRQSVDYLIFGTVFPSRSKPEHHPVAGLAGLGAVCTAVDVPVLAIGGVTADRAPAIAAAGAAGLAAISLFAEAQDIAETVRAVRDALTLPERRV